MSNQNSNVKFMSGQLLQCTECAAEAENREKSEPMERHGEGFMEQAALALRTDV